MKNMNRSDRCLHAARLLGRRSRVWVIALAVIACAGAAIAGPDDTGDEWPKGKPAPAKPDAKKPPAKPDAKKPDAPKPPAGESETDRIKREGRELFNRPAGGGRGASETGAKGWAVVIAAFKGEDREKAAAAMLNRCRAHGLVHAYAARRRETVIVAVGDFDSPDDPRALAELRRIQGIEVDGIRPYEKMAMLAPPLDWKMAGSTPQFDLGRVKKALGDDALYTLQVGAYGRRDLDQPTQEDLAPLRKAAEEAVASLRSEGEQAFYYHDRQMSMVTVGVFNTTDYDPQVPTLKSRRLREAQTRHPLNLYNGAGIRVKHKGGRVEMQSSMLVEIPKG